MCSYAYEVTLVSRPALGTLEEVLVQLRKDPNVIVTLGDLVFHLGGIAWIKVFVNNNY